MGAFYFGKYTSLMVLLLENGLEVLFHEYHQSWIAESAVFLHYPQKLYLSQIIAANDKRKMASAEILLFDRSLLSFGFWQCSFF